MPASRYAPHPCCFAFAQLTTCAVRSLADELDLLQYLHGWRLVQFDSTRVELSHRAELGCTLALQPGGVVEDFEVVVLDSTPASTTDSHSDMKASLTRYFFDRLQSHLQTVRAGLTAKARFQCTYSPLRSRAD